MQWSTIQSAILAEFLCARIRSILLFPPFAKGMARMGRPSNGKKLRDLRNAGVDDLLRGLVELSRMMLSSMSLGRHCLSSSVNSTLLPIAYVINMPITIRQIKKNLGIPSCCLQRRHCSPQLLGCSTKCYGCSRRPRVTRQ